MFLRSTRRKKDGKEHRYFSVVENRRHTTIARLLCTQSSVSSFASRWSVSRDLRFRGRSPAIGYGARNPRTLQHATISVYGSTDTTAEAN